MGSGRVPDAGARLVGEIVEAQLEQMAKVRDGTSRFPTSNTPAPSCDIDHTVPYDYGGSGERDGRADRGGQPRRDSPA